MPNTGLLSIEMEMVKLIPITKPGKNETADPTKFRPISLINVGGKLLKNGNQHNYAPRVHKQSREL
jgi:hypothetical protein